MRELRGTPVVVTGGAGFIGSHTVGALLDRGARVAVLDNFSTGSRRNLDPRATLYEMNIADAAVDAVLERERPEVIYHFAAYVLVPKSVENPLLDMDVLVGAVRVLRKARDLGVKKVVLASSGFLYGNTPRLPAREDDAVDPVSPYVVVKQAIENYLRFFRTAYGLPYAVLRYAAVYGPRQVTGAMPDYIRKLSSGQQAEIWGDGRKTRDYVFINDVVEANLLALDVPDDHPDPVFNIGTGVETTLATLYQKIAVLVGAEARPIYHPERPGEQLRYCLDATRARQQLGWAPRYTLDDALRVTVEAALARQA